MTATEVIANLRKAFALVAKGLVEREQQTQRQGGDTLMHGINMFLAMSVQEGHVKADEAFRYADETAFLRRFAALPIRDWFEDWDPEVLQWLQLEDELFYGCEALAYQRTKTTYTPSGDCLELLKLQDSDILGGTDERLLYEKMRELDPESYCRVRKFIIEHPYLTWESWLHCQAVEHKAAEAIRFAYGEELHAGEYYVCPECGWVLEKGEFGLQCCCSWSCAPSGVNRCRKIQAGGSSHVRLRRGIMRYIAIPGKLELEIYEECRKLGTEVSLWPGKFEMDEYDVEIRFPDGEQWEIDAKAYRNPVLLRGQVEKDTKFPSKTCARGYYVIPDAYKKGRYLSVVNKGLTNRAKVKCIAVKDLKKLVAEKVGA